MAEAIARQLGGDTVRARSAGLAPTGVLAERTVAVLAELGYQTHGLASKGLEAITLGEVDVVVSLIGRDALRHLPPNLAAERVVWAIPDPYGEDLATYRRVARRIESRVHTLLAELGLLADVS